MTIELNNSNAILQKAYKLKDKLNINLVFTGFHQFDPVSPEKISMKR